MQRPANISDFFRDVVGAPSVTPEVLMSRTGPSRAWVARYAAEQGIPFVPAPTGVRKEALVAPYDRRCKPSEGVVAILSSTEQGRTFVSYIPRYPPPSGDPDSRLISGCRKRFRHSYFSLLDPVLGPMSVRVGTSLPFTLAVFRTGHSFLAQELTRLGVGFRKDDNAGLAVDDLAALEAAAERLTPRPIEQRCAHWARRLAPSFSAAEQAALPLGYRYSVAQIELATDVIFTRSALLKALFRRATELGMLLGGADRTTQLCGRRITARYGGKLQTVLDRRNAGQPILRSDSGSSFVTPYEQGDRLLRTETCGNNTYDLGIGHSLEHLPALHERMQTTNTRSLEAQAELLASTVDTAGHWRAWPVP